MQRILYFIFLLGLIFILVACAGLRDDSLNSKGASNQNGIVDSGCEDCGTQGEIKLKITNEKYYREWNPKAFSRIDSNAVLGVFPALKVIAKRPETCKMCHSFSADALDFDLARIEDSLFVKAFPNMKRELMLPGMRLPDEDSLYLDTLSVKILKSKFADEVNLENPKPWIERNEIEQAFSREVPNDLKELLNSIASRYGLRYLSIPIFLEVEMIPSIGKSGGFTWKIIWTMWDARYGELVFLIYSDYTAETTSRISPEKDWAFPFANLLWKMFIVDFSQLENH